MCSQERQGWEGKTATDRTESGGGGGGGNTSPGGRRGTSEEQVRRHPPEGPCRPWAAMQHTGPLLPQRLLHGGVQIPPQPGETKPDTGGDRPL